MRGCQSKSTLLLAKPENFPAREKQTMNSSTGRWILLVEDEDELRSAIGKYLAEEGGYHVTGVADARSAMLVCRGIVRPNSNRSRFKFDPHFNHHLDGLGKNLTNNATQLVGGPNCIVLDIRLGTMNGLELLKIIRSDPMLENLPVVLLTAKGKVEDRVLGYKVGADAYIAKPFDPEELLSVVNGLLMRDKFSASGDPERTDNNGDLKRELMEIKALMHEFDGTSDSTPMESLHHDLLELKEKIKSNIKQVDDGESNRNIHDQFSMLSLLTPEETEVINFVAQDMTNKDISREMKCSVSKIEKYVSAMFKKAGVANRADLISWWDKSLQGDANARNLHKETNAIEAPNEELLGERSSTLLTPDEKVVMDFLEQGMTTDELASKTQSTKRKIGKQLDNMLKKANVKNRTELVRWWRAGGREEVGREEKDT
ncbi:hypothetical protein ACHAXR_012091 [Thalassiosira sp. AJA248-18]